MIVRRAAVLAAALAATACHADHPAVTETQDMALCQMDAERLYPREPKEIPAPEPIRMSEGNRADFVETCMVSRGYFFFAGGATDCVNSDGSRNGQMIRCYKRVPPAPDNKTSQ